MALTKTPYELTAADLTITTAAQPNITSLGTLTTLTIDDITINGSTISDGGDLTLDVGGDLTIDVDDADILLKDGGTTFGQFAQSSGDFHILQPTADKDILFRGLDDSTYINALTLDMSEGGAATFNGELIAPNGATEGYHIKQTGGTATPRITNDANNWTILRPGASGSDVAINNYANSANLVIFTDEGAAGIGTTPKSWNSNFKALQIGPWGSLATTTSGNGESFRLNANYYNDGSAEKYLGTGYALMFREAVTGGSFIFSSSQASGSADGSIASWYHSEIHNHSWAASLETTTSDGSDNWGVGLDAGGGAGSTSRGAALFVYGNEHTSNPGHINAQVGQAGAFRVYTGASADERFRVQSDGNIRIGGTNLSNLTGGMDGITLADEASVTISTAGTATVGGGLLCIYDQNGGESGLFRLQYGGPIAVSAASIYATTSVDGKYCVTGSGHATTFQNRYGQSRSFNIAVYGAGNFNYDTD